MSAKTRLLEAEWAKVLAAHSKPLEKGAKAKGVVATKTQKSKFPSLKIPEDRQTLKLPSVDSGKGSTGVARSQQYTGTNMLGVSQMHKSNAVPVFTQSDILDISKMRRS